MEKMNNKTMTLEKIRAGLPTHIMLTPGVHRWREGDKVPLHNGNFIAVCSEDIGNRPDCLSVREIPPHILDNQAFWILYNSMATLNGRSDGWVIYLVPFQDDEGVWIAETRIERTDRNYGLRKFSSKEKAIEFDNAVMHMKGYYEHMDGQRYDKWLREQMEGV